MAPRTLQLARSIVIHALSLRRRPAHLERASLEPTRAVNLPRALSSRQLSGILLLFALLAAIRVAGESGRSSSAHWAFQPIQRPTPPENSGAGWGRTEIDSFVLARLRAVGASPAPQAEPRALIRRASFDLTGLPPSPEDVEVFLADKSADAFARLVDRLLASPRYGEHWARHWLDVVRYADTAGETADYPVPLAWRYRNYVIDSFNADKPYDQFIREQIAGDILSRDAPPARSAECLTATGYLAISRRFGFDSENYHHLTIQDTIDNVGQAFLGLSLGCARCHDHKYDPVSAADYYALYGIFDSTRYAFPGSEQKQKYRAMLPLRSAPEAQKSWQSFDERIAFLIRKLERNQQGAPGAVLRSLADCDGDFEMQAPAAGGSKGVLVPPWIYEGQIAVTREAQSPFANLYALGRVGASLPSGTNAYSFGQALYPARSHREGGTIFINLDFRPTSGAEAEGGHRFWMGSRQIPNDAAPTNAERSNTQASGRPRIVSSAAFEFLVRSNQLALRSGDGTATSLCSLRPNEWNNLRLRVNLSDRTLSGELAQKDRVYPIASHRLLEDWNGSLHLVGFESETGGSRSMPGLDLDNFGVRESEIAPPSSPQQGQPASEPTIASLSDDIRKLAGMDGDFEFQEADKAPVKPWGPGPNSVVKISSEAQSPYHHIYPAGRLGIRLPSGAAYNGFGQTLTNTWKAAQTDRLHASFDFRVTATAASPATWRFYLGHGAGPGPAVMLFINDRAFFLQNQDAVAEVVAVKTGVWHHVEFTLDLKGKRFTGWVGDSKDRAPFEGSTPAGWDGWVDYLFIDSYGHIGGAKPTIDADNILVSETPLPAVDSAVEAIAADRRDRSGAMARLRGQVATLTQDLEAAKQELNTALAAGPSEMAYGVVEGTPHNARIQLRGDPEQLGAEAPRGFPRILGGDVLPSKATGSGRLELAEWITRSGNPLTARVMANRVWQYHFGRGLVTTPNDFGIRGKPPTHPELLDFLATRLVESGWSLKETHRLIMNSSVYQQASSRAPGDRATPSDPENALYSRFNRRRLEAEALRDSVLLVSGALDETPGQGHAFPAPTTWGYTQHSPFSAVYEHNKRSVYLMAQRIKRHPFLSLFDGADPNSPTPSRSISTVPTQALYFMNDPFVHEKSAQFAAKLQHAGSTELERVTLAYQWALGRAPSAIEIDEARDFLARYRSELKSERAATADSQSLAALARTLFGSNEFSHID
ncbi:MAG: DUF1553 domain-containing protein [Verrucomicrobia bacterium]|nr:DUF1553 domain-containing protein [Verrucomicrobiota bacterium]